MEFVNYYVIEVQFVNPPDDFYFEKGGIYLNKRMELCDIERAAHIQSRQLASKIIKHCMPSFTEQYPGCKMEAISVRASNPKGKTSAKVREDSQKIKLKLA
jgi:hypothetical protein